MSVDARVEQLRVYPHSVSGLLHATFEHSGHSQFAGHGLQVFWLAFVFSCGRTRNNLQVPDASEFSQDLILNPIGEISVRFFLAQVFEWQHRYAFFRRSQRGSRAITGKYYDGSNDCPEREQCCCRRRPADSRALLLQGLELFWQLRIAHFIRVKIHDCDTRSVFYFADTKVVQEWSPIFVFL